MNTLIIMTGIVLCIAILVSPTMYQQIVKHQDIQKEVEQIKEDFKEVSQHNSNAVAKLSDTVNENAKNVDRLENDILKDYTRYVKMLSDLTDKLYEREQKAEQTGND